MSRLLLFVILCYSLTQCNGQKEIQKSISVDNKCREAWQYFSLDDTLTGQVLFHAKAPFLCGTLATASLTIVKTVPGDTIRVLELCNINKDIAKSALVKISPANKSTFGVTLPFDNNKEDCNILKTCYGVINSAN